MTLVVGHSAALADVLEIGASLAVDGVCLTVVTEDAGGTSTAAASAFEVSPETLARTRLGALRPGDEVNLEPALRMGDALGGHWVQGHVDGVLEVVARRDREDHRELSFSLPEAYRTLVVEKGSVTLDGVSLTVSALDDAAGRFSVALVPHTLQVTTLQALAAGDLVHFEADVLAKYVQRAVEPWAASNRRP